MSAMGHKRTLRGELAMSALPPKADIAAQLNDVSLSLKKRKSVGTIWSLAVDIEDVAQFSAVAILEGNLLNRKLNRLSLSEITK